MSAVAQKRKANGSSSSQGPQRSQISKVQNSDNLEKMIKDNKFSSAKELKSYLISNTIEQLFKNKITDGSIEQHGEFYFTKQGHKLTKEQLMKVIRENSKAQIMDIVTLEYEKAKNLIKIQKNKAEISNIGKKISDRNIEIDKFKKDLDNQETVFDRKTQLYLDALHKQTQAKSDMRKEQAQLEFNMEQLKGQQQGLSLQDQSLIASLETNNLRFHELQLAVERENTQAQQSVLAAQQAYNQANQAQQNFDEAQRQRDIRHKEVQEQQERIAKQNADNLQILADQSARNTEVILQSIQINIDANAASAAAASDQNQANTAAILSAIQANADAASAVAAQFAASNAAQAVATAAIIKGFDALNKPPPPPPIPPSCGADRPSCARTDPTSHWVLQTQNARSRSNPQSGPVTIWRCSLGGHFCASNGETELGKRPGDSSWNSVRNYFTGV